MSLSRRSYNVWALMLLLLPLALGACDSTTIIIPLTTPPVSVATPFAAGTRLPDSPSVSQTLDGITVTVQPLHADAHRITLAVSVDGPAMPDAYAVWRYPPWASTANDLPKLSVDGKVLPWIESASGAIAGAAHPGEQLHGQGTMVFDASTLRPVSGTLPIRLSIPMYVENNFVFQPEPLPYPVPTSAVPVTDTPMPPTPSPLPNLPPSILSFALSMTMPFEPQQTIVAVGQTVESNGVKVTLEQIDITPSEARVRLRYSPTRDDTFLKSQDWVASGPINIGSNSGNVPLILRENAEDEEYPGDPGRCNSSSSSNPCFLSYLDPPFLSDKPVDITLTLTAYSSSTHQGPWPAPPPYGTWLFHFTIPAASK